LLFVPFGGRSAFPPRCGASSPPSRFDRAESLANDRTIARSEISAEPFTDPDALYLIANKGKKSGAKRAPNADVANYDRWNINEK